MKFWRRIYESCLLITLVACTQARLEVKNTQSLTTSSLSGSYCSKLGRSSQQPLKVVFVIDMSMSNLGQFQGSRFDTSTGTDLNAERLLAVEKFIDDCGATNPNNEYSVIGFSNGILTAELSQSCSRPFLKTPSQATAALQSLRKIQEENLAFYSGQPNQMKEMAETDYSKAIDCANRVIDADLSKNSIQRPHYQVFFLTDGKPNPDPCGGNGSCYGQKIELLMQQVTTQNSLLRFQPIYYGRSSEKAAALSFMTPMAEAGGVDKVQVVENIQSLSLCDLTSKPLSVRYRKESAFAVNLTAKMIRGGLKADSDMDGIVDEAEKTLGFDPRKARTLGVLDGVCSSLGGATLCQRVVDGLRCKGELNNFGLTDCDTQALKLESLRLGDAGIDSDGDSIPDFLEVIRDSLPNYDDSTSDLDGDSVINRVEVTRGTQVNYPDSGVERGLQVQFTESMVRGDACAENQETWRFQLDNVPLISVSGYTETAQRNNTQTGLKKSMNFSHGDDENVVVIIYKSIPENDATLPSELWGTVLKIPYQRRQSNIILNPNDFFLLGEVQQ